MKFKSIKTAASARRYMTELVEKLHKDTLVYFKDPENFLNNASKRSYQTKTRLDLIKMTKSGGIRTQKTDDRWGYFAISQWFKHVVYADNMDYKDENDICNHILSKTDIESLKEEFINMNQAEITKRKTAAKKKREENKKNKRDRQKPPTEMPTGFLAHLPENLAKELVGNNSENVRLFIEQPEWLQHHAVRCSSRALEYIKEPLDSTYDEIVKSKTTGISMLNMNDFSEERQKELKRESLKASKGASVQYMRKLDEELQLLAVSLSRTAIKHVRSPSEKVKRLNAMKWKL